MHGFALPPHKRARAGSPSSSSSLERNSAAPVLGGSAHDSGAEDEREDRVSTFGEKLRAGKDEEDGSGDEENSRMNLTEQEGGRLSSLLLSREC